MFRYNIDSIHKSKNLIFFNNKNSDLKTIWFNITNCTSLNSKDF